MSYGKVEYDPLLDAFKCEECQRWFCGLSRHVSRHHGLTAREYKRKWGLNVTQRLLSKKILAHLSDKAYATGVNKNLELGANHKFKKGDSSRQSYKRSEQTLRQLRLIRKISHKKKK